MQSPGSKEDKLLRLSKCVLVVLNEGGIEALNPSRLARMASVSRPWIYKMVGAKKADLVGLALDLIGRGFAGIDSAYKANSLKELVEELRGRHERLLSYIQDLPDLIFLYMKFRGSKNPIGDKIHEIEMLHIRQFTDVLTRSCGLPKDEAKRRSEAYLPMRMGVVHKMASNPSSLKNDEALSYLSKAAQGLFS